MSNQNRCYYLRRPNLGNFYVVSNPESPSYGEICEFYSMEDAIMARALAYKIDDWENPNVGYGDWEIGEFEESALGWGAGARQE